MALPELEQRVAPGMKQIISKINHDPPVKCILESEPPLKDRQDWRVYEAVSTEMLSDGSAAKVPLVFVKGHDYELGTPIISGYTGEEETVVVSLGKRILVDVTTRMPLT